ncbi:MAG: hypothetical protein ACW99Q_23105 [Candidatus Kariarchaeaceae archaeon]
MNINRKHNEVFLPLLFVFFTLLIGLTPLLFDPRIDLNPYLWIFLRIFTPISCLAIGIVWIVKKNPEEFDDIDLMIYELRKSRASYNQLYN